MPSIIRKGKLYRQNLRKRSLPFKRHYRKNIEVPHFPKKGMPYGRKVKNVFRKGKEKLSKGFDSFETMLKTMFTDDI